jgi:hypothetical protein
MNRHVEKAEEVRRTKKTAFHPFFDFAALLKKQTRMSGNAPMLC